MSIAMRIFENGQRDRALLFSAQIKLLRPSYLQFVPAEMSPRSLAITLAICTKNSRSKRLPCRRVPSKHLVLTSQNIEFHKKPLIDMNSPAGDEEDTPHDLFKFNCKALFIAIGILFDITAVQNSLLPQTTNAQVVSDISCYALIFATAYLLYLFHDLLLDPILHASHLLLYIWCIQKTDSWPRIRRRL